MCRIKQLSVKVEQFVHESILTVDSKGRVTIPAALKKLIEDCFDKTEAEKFIIKRGLDKCVVLYTKTQWEKAVRKVQKLNNFNTRARMFKLKFSTGANRIEPDASNKILIPAELRAFAGIESGTEIIITALYDQIQIWNYETYKQCVINDEEGYDFNKESEDLLGQDILDDE